MKRITLTFDNGPDPHTTPAVLDVLRERGVRAHFFVLGRAIEGEAGRALVARALAEGHRVGNHSFSHGVPLGDDPREDAVDAEIVATAALLTELAPDEPRLFRPFGGGGKIGPHLLSRRAATHLVDAGYTCVLWTSVPRDWEDQAGWSARALADCEAREHSVVVLHDVPNACLSALGAFIDEARARGFDFVTDLPPDVTPIKEGLVTLDLRPIVRESAQT